MMKMAKIPTLTGSNVMNSFQTRFPTDSAIRSSESSSTRFVNEILPASMVPLIASRAMVLIIDGFSTENIICALKWSRSLLL